jgi:hypothetical protein
MVTVWSTTTTSMYPYTDITWGSHVDDAVQTCARRAGRGDNVASLQFYFV